MNSEEYIYSLYISKQCETKGNYYFSSIKFTQTLDKKLLHLHKQVV